MDTTNEKQLVAPETVEAEAENKAPKESAERPAAEDVNMEGASVEKNGGKNDDNTAMATNVSQVSADEKAEAKDQTENRVENAGDAKEPKAEVTNAGDTSIKGQESKVEEQSKSARESSEDVVDSQKKSLWIQNLMPTCKASDLKVLFAAFGKVVTAKIYTTRAQTPICYGFVTMDEAESAAEAQKKLNRTMHKGRVLTISLVAKTPTSGRMPQTDEPKADEQPQQEVAKASTAEKPAIVTATPSGQAPEKQPIEKATTTKESDAVPISDDEITIVKENLVSKAAPADEKPKTVKASPTKTAQSDKPSKVSPAKQVVESASQKASKKAEAKVPIKAPESSPKSSSSAKEGKPRKSTKSRSPHERSPSRVAPVRNSRLNIRRTGGRRSPYNDRREENRQIRTAAARFSSDRPQQKDFRRQQDRPRIRYDVEPAPRPAYNVHRTAPSMYGMPYAQSRAITTQQQQAQQLYNQSDLIRILQQQDEQHRKKELILEREHARVQLELERQAMEAEKIRIEKERVQLELEKERLERQKRLDSERRAAANTQSAYSSSSYPTAPKVSVQAPRAAPKGDRRSSTGYERRERDSYADYRTSDDRRYVESNRYSNRSRSPHARRSDSDRYYKESSSSRAPAPHRRADADSDYYGSSSRSGRQQAANAQSYSSSSYAATKPDESLRQLAAEYEKRVTGSSSMDAYGRGTSGTHAYDSRSAYELQQSSRSAAADYGTSSYATAAEPSAASSSSYRYPTEYSHAQTSSSAYTQQTQPSSWGTTSGSYATPENYARQSDWSSGTNAYDTSIQYEHARRF